MALAGASLPKPGQAPHFWAGLLHSAVASDPALQALSGPEIDAGIAKVEDRLFAKLQGAAGAAGKAGAAGGAGSAGGTAHASYRPTSAAVVSRARWTSSSPSIPRAVLVQGTGTGTGTPSGAPNFIGLGVTMAYGSDAAKSGIPAGGASATVTDNVRGVDVAGSFGVTPSGTQLTMNLSKGGVRYAMKVKESLTGEPCPNAAGGASGQFDVQFSESGGTGSTSGGASVAAKGTFTVTVDDNAEISAVVSDGSTIRNQTVNGSVTSNSVGLHSPLDGSFSGSNVVTTYRMTTPGQAAFDEEAALARDALNGIVTGVVYHWRALWQGGACVAVSADLASKVKPGSTNPFTAKVTHTPDSATLDAPVTAKLDSGAVSVSPDRIDKAPGQFTYVAPDTAGSTASLTLTSTSRRGIGTLSLHVGPQHYTASGGLGPVSISGSVDDLDKPFDLEVSSPGASGTVTFLPSSATAGKLRGTSKLGFSTEVSTGSYTLTETKTGYLATGKVRTCLTIVKTCSPTANVEVRFTAD